MMRAHLDIPLRVRVKHLGRHLAASVFFLTGCNLGPWVGYRYATESAVSRAMKGYVLVGQLAEEYPARFVRRVEGDDSVSFELAGGNRHLYRGFGGYHLCVLVFETRDNTEMALVYRSEEKR